MLRRDSRSVFPCDNYALEDVSGVFYDFEKDILYTGRIMIFDLCIGTRAGLLHIWK